MTGSDVVPGMVFGIDVAINGNAVLVGAEGGALAGAAYVFRFNGTSWTQEDKLAASDGAPHDHFGVSVALSSDTALVGAMQFEPPPPPNGPPTVENGPGAAYVFRRNGGVWSQEAKLLATDGEIDDRFGIAVAVDVDTPLGDTAVIGADLATQERGTVYVFRRISGAWQEAERLAPSDSTQLASFGIAVSLNGNYIAVGAADADGGCIGDPDCSSGAAYVFSTPCVFGIPALSPFGIATLAIVLCLVGIGILRRSGGWPSSRN